MKKVIVILIVLALVGAGTYYFIIKKDDAMPVCEAGFRLDFGTRTCVPVGGSQQANAVDFSKVEISMQGDSSVKAQLVRQGDSTRYVGTFNSGSGADAVRGSVSLDSSKTVQFSGEYVLVPLSSDFGGTGQFADIGLFNAKTNTYLGSVSVGDRIDIGSIEVKGSVAKVNYKTRLDSEPMVATPSIPAQLVVEVKDNSIREIMRLQNADYNDVEIKSPGANTTVAGEFVLKGSMPGSWYFEANAQFRVIDSTYKEVAIGSIQALSDWMTTQRVPFEVKLNTAAFNTTGKAYIVVSSENVRGDEEGERGVKKMQIPVTIR